MNNSIKFFATIAILISVCSCNINIGNSYSESATPVMLTDLSLHSIEEYITTTGTAKASKNVTISTETNGSYSLQENPRTKKPYQLGDIVEKGDIIIKLENQEYLNNNVQLESKKLEVEIAKKEWDGQKQLYKKGGATLKDVQNAEKSYIGAKSSLETANISLKKLYIVAPFKGVIVALPYFTPKTEVASGTEVLQIMDYSKMYIETQFPENTLGKLKVKQNVHITNYNIKDDTLVGTLTQLSPAISEDTRTFAGFIEISNPDLKLRPGMFAKADIVTIRKDSVLAIEKEYIKYERNLPVVFTVNRNTAEIHRIKTGISNEKYIEVIDGLKINDKIVLKGFEWLKNRSKVKVTK